MDFPASKRLKGHQLSAGPDTFDDDIDFTQDDLAQIDIIASQAITRDGQNSGLKRTFGSVFALDEQSKAPVRSIRKALTHGDECSSSTLYNDKEPQRKDVFGDGHSGKDKEDLYYKQLEEQQEELKKKLKEVEEEILMKNGEIQVLRDSLRLASQEKEQQRQSQLTLEKEKAHARSEREKELSRKVQSLQSELHFKEAEMNEMKGKLKNVECGGKICGTPARNNIHAPAGRAFMTRETFSAELSKRTSPIKRQLLEDEKSAQSKSSSVEEPHSERNLRSDPHQEGCPLLNFLLQQPLDPSSLGLCHLLSISPDALPNILSQHGYVSPGSLPTSSSSSTELRAFHRPQAQFHQLQDLAMSALTALALRHPPNVLRNGNTPTLRRSCTSAVHFLPLLAFHISTYCQLLESVESSGKTSLHGSSLSGSSDSSLALSLEESLSSQEEFALAAMKALNHVVCYSSEALEMVLCHSAGEISEQSDVNRPQCSKNILGTAEHLNGESPHRSHTQLPLLRRLLQLADPAFVTGAGQREAVVSTSLRTLCLLAENAPENQLLRLKDVMSSQVLTKCLTLETSCRIVHLSVRFLSFIVYNDEMATKLCSHEYPCPLLRIFQYVTSRPDKFVSKDVWSRLELELIRLLAKLLTQKSGTLAALCESSCQCINEMVRTVVVGLHKQWLKTKRQQSQTASNRIWTSPGFQVLRESLMLLHWLLLNDSSFSEHCLDVLYMYDQVIPAIRDTFRLVPDLSESEELALEEICRSETEYVEDMDTETGS
ncbi:ATR-interacting protein [Myxocyprinus asiaticus]|uniref:ATR-interacting protein n=1 Tax=Myxocyprinus asiaticus TaxID=70543 RepID=UPI002223D450|nr:ATR-interacting protein [Myxocyprinus asiaticus]XP_051550170.1 ATR-interacting protein [Myxocyprinus asiaticus]